MLTPRQRQEADARYRKLVERMDAGLLAPDFVLTQMDDLSDMRTPTTPNWYEPLDEQSRRLGEFLLMIGTQLPDIPPVPGINLGTEEVLMPVVYLPKNGKLSAARHTFHAWQGFLDLILRQRGFRLQNHLHAGTLQELSYHPSPGAHWGVFHLGQDPHPLYSTMDALWNHAGGKSFAGPEVLMALCFFPKLLDQPRMIRLHLGGYRFQALQETTICLDINPEKRLVTLSRVPGNSYLFEVIAPRFRLLS